MMAAAAAPHTAGQPEPLAMDEAKKPLTLLHQCCVEQRVVGEEGEDAVVRCGPTGRRRRAVLGGCA